MNGRPARIGWGRAIWLLVLVVAVGSLVVSEAADQAPRTNADRVHALAVDDGRNLLFATEAT